MVMISYRVTFKDGGVGMRRGEIIIMPIGNLKARMAIQSPTGSDPFRYLIHVASGQIFEGSQPIEVVMRDYDMDPYEAARKIFNDIKNKFGEKELIKSMSKQQILNHSQYL